MPTPDRCAQLEKLMNDAETLLSKVEQELLDVSDPVVEHRLQRQKEAIKAQIKEYQTEWRTEFDSPLPSSVSVGAADLRPLVQAYLAALDEDFKKFDDPNQLIPLATLPGKLKPSNQPPRPLRRDLAKLQEFLSPGYSPLPPQEIPMPDDNRLEVSVEDYLAEHTRITLLGAPGSGKSTTLRRLVRFYGKPWREQATTDEVDLPPIPIFAALNRWQDANQDLPTFLQERLVELGATGLAEQLPRLFEQGGVVLLLDGLNELPQLQRTRESREIDDPRARAIAQLGERDAWQTVSCVLSCRVRDFVGGPRWHDLHVLDLTRQQVEKLAEAYFEGDPEAEQLTRDLMAQLYERDDRPVARLQGLANQPFYLTKLLAYYYNERILPDNPAQLISFTINAALQREKDAGRLTDAEAVQLEAGLARLAFNFTTANRVGGLEQKQAAAWFFRVPNSTGKLKKIKSKAKQLEQAEQFFQQAEAAGLLTRQGDNVQFYHQLFQEYFCARYCQTRRFTTGFLIRTSHPAFDRVWPFWAVLDPNLEDSLIALVKPSFKNRILNWLGSISISKELQTTILGSFKEEKKPQKIRYFLRHYFNIHYFYIYSRRILRKKELGFYSIPLVFFIIAIFTKQNILFLIAFFLIALPNLPYFKKPRYAQVALQNLTSTKASFFQQTAFEVKDARFYSNRGWAYNGLKQYKRAIQDYDQAIILDPKFANAYNGRGVAYLNLGQYECAIHDFDEVINLNPKYLSTFSNRGRAYTCLKQYERAIQDYDKGISLEPKNESAYNGRGIAYSDLKQYERAIQDYNKVINLNSKAAYAFNNRGNAYRYLKQYERAIQDYDEAIRLAPKAAYAFNNRGLAYRALKQYERAIQDYDQAISLDPKFDWAFFSRGSACVCLKQYEKAKNDFGQVYALVSTDINAGWMAAWVGLYQFKEAPVEYIPLLVERLSTLVGSASEEYKYVALVCQGVALLLQKQYDLALNCLEESLAVDPEEWDAPFWLAMVQAYRGEFEAALTMLDKVLGLSEGLLFPLKWLEKDQPEFFRERLQPWLEQHQIEL
jgi:tetratricopeptide (TPR) repeat protein